MDEKDTAPAGDKILQEPAEGDRATIDRELERKDGGNVAHHDADKDRDADVHDTVRKAMDEAAPQTGVRPGP
ncbi:MAG: hypothetical protein ABW055_01675 [Pararhizobium sp.]